MSNRLKLKFTTTAGLRLSRHRIPFRRGDVQFLNNWVTLHSRRAYEDWPEAARKRHLLRLWLSDAEGRPVPKEQRAGRAGRGVLPAGVELNAPLDVEGIA